MNAINNILTLSSLRNDLIEAFEFAKQQSDVRNGLMRDYETLSGEWVYAIDPSNLQLLEQIKMIASDDYTFNSLAHDIRTNKKIKSNKSI